jgi:hypothetical protein
MGRFDDDRLEEIYQHGATYGVSPDECFLIRRKLIILMAARSRITLSVIGRPFAMPEGRLAVPVTPDWAISFDWFEEVGVFAMRLEP